MSRGGRREGAGRPKGSRDVLPRGAVQAIKSLRLRVPEDAAPEHADLADRAFSRIVDVMDEQVLPDRAFAVLAAAKAVREEICGKQTEKVELDGKVEIVIEKIASPAASPLRSSPLPERASASTEESDHAE